MTTTVKTDVQRIADIMEQILYRKHDMQVEHTFEHRIRQVVHPERTFENHYDEVTISNMLLSEYDCGHIECTITPNDGGDKFDFPIRLRLHPDNRNGDEVLSQNQIVIVANYLVEQLLYWQ